MRGCGCSFTPVENKETEEIKYTDALAEQFAAEVGVDPRPNETLVEIDERGAFIRQPNAFIQPFGDKEGGLKAESKPARDLLGNRMQLVQPSDHRAGAFRTAGCDLGDESFSIRRDKPLRTCIRTVSGFQGSGDRRLLLK